MYKYLLFDADNTLLDFDRAEASALEKTLLEFPIGFSEEIRDIYHQINIEEWKRLEKKETTREKLKVERFDRLYQYFNIYDENIGEKTARQYENNLSYFGYIIDGADDLLNLLSRKYSIYVVTNGSTSIQVSRMKMSGLNKYIKHTFISEEIGVTKPDKEFFDNVISFIGDYDLSKYLVIGDSISSDINGANNYGIDSVFYSPDGCEKKVSTYMITDLKQLCEIL